MSLIENVLDTIKNVLRGHNTYFLYCKEEVCNKGYLSIAFIRNYTKMSTTIITPNYR